VITEEAVDAFGQVNAVFHAYPYFREFVQSSAGRMNLPNIIMPAMPGKGLFGQINDDALKVLPMRGKRPAPDRQAANQ